MTKRANIYSSMVEQWPRLERPCDLCGNAVCYNNFPDHRGRQKRYIYKGKFLCPRCDPRVIVFGGKRHESRISNRRLYKAVMSVVIVERLADEFCVEYDSYTPEDCGKCLSCMARKLVKIEVV